MTCPLCLSVLVLERRALYQARGAAARLNQVFRSTAQCLIRYKMIKRHPWGSGYLQSDRTAASRYHSDSQHV